MGLLKTLQPQWWFSAHLHVRFEATVVHEGNPLVAQPISETTDSQNPDEIMIEDDDFAHETCRKEPVPSGPLAPTVSRNQDEITLDDEEEEVISPPPLPPPRMETKFLALDKCLPRRNFLEVSTHEPRLSLERNV
jgi:lariat debranching enzyme